VESISDLLSHPWFKRSWIIQEVVLAKKATIFSGSAKTDFGFLWNTCAGITCHELTLSYDASIENSTLRKVLAEMQVNISRLGVIGLLRVEKKMAWYARIAKSALCNPRAAFDRPERQKFSRNQSLLRDRAERALLPTAFQHQKSSYRFQNIF